MTLLEFLEARLAEDWQLADEADGSAGRVRGTWSVRPEQFQVATILAQGYYTVVSDVVVGAAHHMARHDPDRVKAEVEAKRQMIDLAFAHEATVDGEWGCCHRVDDIAKGECPETPVDDIEGLRVLAAPYSGHADYEARWAVTPES